MRDDVFPTWVLQKNGSHRSLLGSGTNQLDVDISTRWTGSIQSGRDDRSINSTGRARQVYMTADNHKLQLVVLHLHNALVFAAAAATTTTTTTTRFI